MSVASVDHFSVGAAQSAQSLQKESRRPTRRQAADGASPPSRRAPLDAAVRPPPVEIAFLAQYGVPAEALHYATTLARRQGVSPDAVLISEGIVAEEVFYRALADHLGAPFRDDAFEIAPGALATAERGYVQLRDEGDGLRWLFAPTGTEIFRLMSAVRSARGRPMFVVTTRARFFAALRRANQAETARAASRSVERVDPDLCARGSLRRGPMALATLALATTIICLFAPVEAARLAAALALGGVFLAGVFLRLAACAASVVETETSDWIEDARLPVYTIVIALYREAAVARQLARAIDRFDYPVLGSKDT